MYADVRNSGMTAVHKSKGGAAYDEIVHGRRQLHCAAVEQRARKVQVIACAGVPV